jgi:IclR family transcriptional regulator, KDG regulon repressor
MRTARKRIKSISRAVRILESFGLGATPTVTELSRSLKLPKSSVFEILSTLAAEGIVAKEERTNRYRLGAKLLELSSLVGQGLEVSAVAEPLLKALNKAVDETVQLTVLDRREILYVGGFESTRQLRTFFRRGDRAPLHCTALGKAILAFLPRAEIDAVIRSGLPRFTSRTLTEGRRLREELARTAARGYAVDNEEHEEGVRCVGAPVRSADGAVFASISVSGPAHRLPPAKDRAMARRVVETANGISRRLGWQARGEERR